MHGYWIFPDGTLHYTNNAESHYAIINECNLIEILNKQASLLTWTIAEIKNGYDRDLTYIALKLGYIRITSYYNQLAIQFEHYSNDIRNISNKQILIDVLLTMNMQLYKNSQITYQCIIIEQLSISSHMIFESFTGCISFLCNS